jgi:hypothetical protein
MNQSLFRIVALALLAIANTSGIASAAEPDPAVLSYRQPTDLKWTENATYPGLMTAVLYGDPAKAGPYAVHNRFPAGMMTRPHSHPNDRFIFVVSGTWWVGTGDKFDPDSTKPMPAGSYVVHYGGKVHYDGAKSEGCEVIIYGMGPGTSKQVGK